MTSLEDCNINIEDYDNQDQYDYDYLRDLQQRMMKVVLKFTKHTTPQGLDSWYYKLCMEQFYTIDISIITIIIIATKLNFYMINYTIKDKCLIIFFHFVNISVI